MINKSHINIFKYLSPDGFDSISFYILDDYTNDNYMNNFNNVKIILERYYFKREDLKQFLKSNDNSLSNFKFAYSPIVFSIGSFKKYLCLLFKKVNNSNLSCAKLYDCINNSDYCEFNNTLSNCFYSMISQRFETYEEINEEFEKIIKKMNNNTYKTTNMLYKFNEKDYE